MPQSQTRPRTKRSPRPDGGERRLGRLPPWGRWRAHHQNSHARNRERGCVDRERDARPHGHEHPAQRRPREAESDRPHELVERVRGGQIGRREKIGHDGVERRHEERTRSAVDGHYSHELPEPKRAGEREQRENGDSRRPDGVCGEHDSPPVEAVAHDPARNEEEDGRHGHSDADECQRCRRVPEGVRLPGNRDQEDPVAEERDRHPGPQDAEVPVAQRREEARPAYASGTVERLVTMLHRIPAAPRAAPIRRCSFRPGTRTARGRPWAGRNGSPGRARTPGR